MLVCTQRSRVYHTQRNLREITRFKKKCNKTVVEFKAKTRAKRILTEHAEKDEKPAASIRGIGSGCSVKHAGAKYELPRLCSSNPHCNTQILILGHSKHHSRHLAICLFHLHESLTKK